MKKKKKRGRIHATPSMVLHTLTLSRSSSPSHPTSICAVGKMVKMKTTPVPHCFSARYRGKKIALFTWVPRKKLYYSKSPSLFFTSTKQLNSIFFNPISFPSLSFHLKSLLPNTLLRRHRIMKNYLKEIGSGFGHGLASDMGIKLQPTLITWKKALQTQKLIFIII